MRLGLVLILAAFGGLTFAQTGLDGEYKLALTDHKGQLKWFANGFKTIQTSAKPDGREIGFRGRDASGRLTFLGFLFLVPEGAPLTTAKCRDGALQQEKKTNPTQNILASSETAGLGSLPVSIMTYTSRGRDGSIGYMVRGFVAAGDLCGDLELYSDKPISAEDADVKRIFSSYQLDANYIPKFGDVVQYAQILYQTQMYKAAAPTFEKALFLLTGDGAPFPSAKIAKRVVTDQAGMSFGIAGEFAKARSIFEKGIAEDSDYPLYYYNLACTDAGENKLADARLHLQQAFARKANMNPGEIMPDPTKDDSFSPFQSNRDFWAFLLRLQAGK